MNFTTQKVAVITGAGGGIGEALADEVTKRGYQIALSDINTDAIERLRVKYGPAAYVCEVDVANPAKMNMFANNVFDRFGRTDIIFNNAGIFNTGRVLEQSYESWLKVMQVNFFGVLNGIKAFMPKMIETGLPAYIVNTASISGLYSSPMVGSYSVSKNAVVALSETLSYECQTDYNHIKVSVICSGAVKTDILDPDRHGKVLARSEKAEQYLSKMRSSLLENGMDPSDLAGFIFKQVMDGKFWITPHPNLLAPVLTRAKAIVAGDNPVFTMTRTKIT